MKLSENIVKALLSVHEKNEHVIESEKGLLSDYEESIKGHKIQMENLQKKIQESKTQNQEIKEMLKPHGSIEFLQEQYGDTRL